MPGAAASDPVGLIGTLLEQKYRIDARVAEGGFGVVYRGQHIGLAQPLAIKILKRPAGVRAPEWGDMVGQFLEEARLVAKLRHPAVVGIIDAGVTHTDEHPEGLPWIAMEWLEGETLAADLARRRAGGESGRTRAEVLALLRPVVEAVAEAHDAGIVHRDLNPNNIMLVAGPVSARILDFGIAKVMTPDTGSPTSATTTGSLRAFSVAYAAPEQLSGARTGPWTDVHALGLIFTELLCGRPALPADDIDAHYRVTFDPTRPTPAAFGVDAGAWEPILARALALNMRDRHASAGDLLAALEGGPTAREHRRRWRVRALALGAIAALVGVGVVLQDRRRDPGHSAPAAAVDAACTSNACSRPGEPAICRPGVGCVALRSQDCQPLADPRALASDDTVWFGAMFPRTGPDRDVFGQGETNAVDLARRDFAQIMSGASTSGALDSARPFGLVVCDDNADPRRAANHLVDLGVPAVIGFYKSVEAIDLIASVFVPHRILAVSSLNSNPLVTRVPHPRGMPRLVWRTTYSNTAAAAALSAWVAQVLEPAPAEHSAPRPPMRVALLRPRDAAGDALSDAFLKALRFNGKAVPDNPGNYREMTYEAEAPRGSAAYAAIERELETFAPNVILYAGNVAIVDDVFAPLEEHWPRARPRPRYASVGFLSTRLLAFIGTSKDRRGRFFGLAPVSLTPANLRYVTHYNEVFPDKITPTICPNSSYDAFYLLAYASYAIPKTEAVTGERLSHAIAKLVPPGRPIEVGLAGIFDAYTALSSGQSVDLTGATGQLDFDLATGEAAFDMSILCVGIDERGQASDGIPSGMVYSAATHKLDGAMRCP
jgi:serine/threonine protein kinase/ABC-type branched-subunit amino acid transport system substrate-binding protein